MNCHRMFLLPPPFFPIDYLHVLKFSFYFKAIVCLFLLSSSLQNVQVLLQEHSYPYFKIFYFTKKTCIERERRVNIFIGFYWTNLNFKLVWVSLNWPVNISFPDNGKNNQSAVYFAPLRLLDNH